MLNFYGESRLINEVNKTAIAANYFKVNDRIFITFFLVSYVGIFWDFNRVKSLWGIAMINEVNKTAIAANCFKVGDRFFIIIFLVSYILRIIYKCWSWRSSKFWSANTKFILSIPIVLPSLSCMTSNSSPTSSAINSFCGSSNPHSAGCRRGTLVHAS